MRRNIILCNCELCACKERAWGDSFGLDLGMLLSVRHAIEIQAHFVNDMLDALRQRNKVHWKKDYQRHQDGLPAYCWPTLDFDDIYKIATERG